MLDFFFIFLFREIRIPIKRITHIHNATTVLFCFFKSVFERYEQKSHQKPVGVKYTYSILPDPV